MTHLRHQIQSLGSSLVTKDAEELKAKANIDLQERLKAYMCRFNPVPTPIDPEYAAFITGFTDIVFDWNRNKPWII